MWQLLKGCIALDRSGYVNNSRTQDFFHLNWKIRIFNTVRSFVTLRPHLDVEAGDEGGIFSLPPLPVPLCVCHCSLCLWLLARKPVSMTAIRAAPKNQRVSFRHQTLRGLNHRCRRTSEEDVRRQNFGVLMPL